MKLVLLIVNDESSQQSDLAHKALSSQETSTLWSLYDRMVIARSSRSMMPVNMAPVLGHLPVIHCSSELACENFQSLSSSNLDEVRQYDLDFVLQLTPDRLLGEILTVPRFGVWSFNHGDPEKISGTPPGFWEIYRDDPVTGAFLQRRVDGSGIGVILRRGFFKTFARSYCRSRDNVLFGSSDWPRQVCRDIQRSRADYFAGSAAPAKAQSHLFPSNLEMIRFGWMSLKAWVRNTIEWFFHQQQWNVGIIDEPIHKVLDLAERRRSGIVTGTMPPSVRWLPEEKGLFLADPFAISRYNGSKGGMTIIAEEYPWKQERGRISITESSDGYTFGKLTPVIELPCHMSYPFLFEHEETIYCIPETFEAREVSLFRAGPSLREWTKVATLVEGFSAVDSTVFQHNGRWWLFCTSQDAGSNSTLFAWHANELTGPWQPHDANPLKIDIRSGRPAGTPFMYEGELYRPAQDCSTGYGAAVVINRVLALTPERFSEEVVAVLKPDPDGPYPNGLHTICVLPEHTIIDGARRTFIPQVFAGLFVSKARRLLRKLRILS
ncbi:hypothetical protein MHY87_01435 [Microvirga sp. ACRRW]|uniref:glucosamine inositolphosphorylceramide transferase family protein n=1 Tax=Microvirga sp. ACRRW TaxID=2918205 RepID=UPI001EF59552|nr:hypothetical protein [Microvirga sp. ACRRW]MCG7391570.1 hypothetical protein [Microvirga sp. ACRRW]